MLKIRGCSALSDFRINKILLSLQNVDQTMTGIHTEYVHFAESESELMIHEYDHLVSLLHYGPVPHPPDPAWHLFLVTPRPGTISPWSSKATDIVHNCGLRQVIRVERGLAWYIQSSDQALAATTVDRIKPLIHDRMTEVVLNKLDDALILFNKARPVHHSHIDIQSAGKDALSIANSEMGLALSEEEIDYLYHNFSELGRNPTDVELMMFAQANSEHCRHKIFNARWTIDGEPRQQSLFDMIRETHDQHPGHILSAYRDNAAVMHGYSASRFFPSPEQQHYRYQHEDVHILMKVETHNHPTAISPYPGAATGSGGEIRDEAATGRGAKPKAGLTGFAVSNLKIPGFIQPWEKDNGKPGRIVSALDIMLEGPIGAASYNNEFGRPALCGYFRTYEQAESGGIIRGYHKPIMLAGGYGMIRDSHIRKHEIPAGAKIIVLGGPAMLIGLGGGAASSMASGESAESLDFASVQRDNAEMQRRCQEVIDRCWAMAEDNPIISIHDVGAGGLSNALPELVSNSGRGAVFELRDIPNDEPGMSPMEVWCNESQERYVLAVKAEAVDLFFMLCRRERAPYAILGESKCEKDLILTDAYFDNRPIDIPLSILLGDIPRMVCNAHHQDKQTAPFDGDRIELKQAVERLLRLPAVADKRFLITIGDRSVSGLVVRDQMVGPWQTPVADCAITASSYDTYVGEAMAIGERTPIALLNAAASGRMAVGEAITNILAARIINLDDIALSANWMAGCGEKGEDARLFDTVQAVSRLCKELGITIPVGKDSLSMNTVWHDKGKKKKVTSPLSLNITAFARVADIRLALTPQLQIQKGDTELILVDLGRRKNRLGGSALTQVYSRIAGEPPDLDDAMALKGLFSSIQLLNETGLILAYHDRSDGGLFVTLCEMAFAGRTGLDITLADDDVLASLFCEELGAVIQIRKEDHERVIDSLNDSGLDEQYVSVIGLLNNDIQLRIHRQGNEIYAEDIHILHRYWSETSYYMQSLRDNPLCAQQEYDQILDRDDPGLFVKSSYNLEEHQIFINTGARPPIVILREQGVNGQVEMAAAFDRAGFDCVDVHMNDIINGHISLHDFRGLAACGGFSFGDVLGAGGGWAKSILFNTKLRDAFRVFFERQDTFALGVCNGCQMLAQLRNLIPGAEHWPEFDRNTSEQFEARLVMVEITASPSILFDGMAGSQLPVVVSHGEGKACFGNPDDMTGKVHTVLRYIDNHGHVAETYPANPNGSPGGLTGFTSTDGRFTIMMPHPERVFLKKQLSWFPVDWQHEESPWMQLFSNARRWVN